MTYLCELTVDQIDYQVLIGNVKGALSEYLLTSIIEWRNVIQPRSRKKQAKCAMTEYWRAVLYRLVKCELTAEQVQIGKLCKVISDRVKVIEFVSDEGRLLLRMPGKRQTSAGQSCHWREICICCRLLSRFTFDTNVSSVSAQQRVTIGEQFSNSYSQQTGNSQPKLNIVQGTTSPQNLSY